MIQFSLIGSWSRERTSDARSARALFQIPEGALAAPETPRPARCRRRTRRHKRIARGPTVPTTLQCGQCVNRLTAEIWARSDAFETCTPVVMLFPVRGHLI